MTTEMQTFQTDNDDSSIDSDRQRLDNAPPGDEIVFDAPAEGFRLGYIDVACLVINRMIGTGIFLSPQSVLLGTRSVGASLVFWGVGAIYALAGMHVYLEYGLNVPRVFHHNREQSVARSGGDLNYLQYVYRWIGYRGQTVLLVTPLFGISFIILGNMAGNCIAFALYVLRAAGHEVNLNVGNVQVRGLALGVAVLACFIHAFSRRGGILLNNILAVFKISVLLLIIVTTIIVASKGQKDRSEQMVGQKAFNNDGQANGYASAFLSISFAYGGFEQPNYVLGEIRRPRRIFPRATIFGVLTACFLYMAVNICYMAVVPFSSHCVEVSGSAIMTKSVAEQFFLVTYSNASYTADGCTINDVNPSSRGYRMFAAFVAASSLGNIIVMTYTAARVKQEIAKTGILPYSKFFADNRDFSFGRFLKWLRDDKQKLTSTLRDGFFSPEHHSERTPVGAFLLHIVSCIVLLFATAGMSPDNAYGLLTKLYAYIINAFNGSLLALGILILRFVGAPATKDGKQLKWSEMTGTTFRPLLSVSCALIFLIGSLFPVVTSWVPRTATNDNQEITPSKDQNTTYSAAWWLLPTVSLAVLVASLLWFVGFLAYAKRREKRNNEVFAVDRVPEFENADDRDRESGTEKGGLILVHETVYLDWRALDMMEDKETVEGQTKQVQL